jgi:hypothetical protein
MLELVKVPLFVPRVRGHPQAGQSERRFDHHAVRLDHVDDHLGNQKSSLGELVGRPQPVESVRSCRLALTTPVESADVVHVGFRRPLLAPSTAEATRDHVEAKYAENKLEGVGHWVPELASEQVSTSLLGHLRTSS